MCVLGVVVAGLSGCAISLEPTSAKAGGMQSVAAAGVLSGQDVMFLTMLVAHNTQSIEMSGYADTNTTTVAVRDIAREIVSVQQKQNAQALALLSRNGASTTPPKSMSGMQQYLVDIATTFTLSHNEGTDFDKYFVQDMIISHKGAINLAENVGVTSTRAEVASLGQQVLATATQQQSALEQLRAR